MILTVGSTGTLGGLITRRLLAQGRDVRILVRPGSGFRDLVQAGALPVLGDIRDRASLTPAFAGVDTVITTANSAQRGGDDNVETVERLGNRNLMDAARAAGVRHFIFTSALGVSQDSPVPFMQAKAEAEEYLKGSGVPFTILAPNIFMEAWFPMIITGPLKAGGMVTLVGEGRRRHSFVSVEDVAAFAVACVDNVATLGRTIPIGGPVAVSWRDIVEAGGRLRGSAIPMTSVAPGEPLAGLPPLIGGFMAAMETYDSELDMLESSRSFGIELTPMETVLRRALEA
jgi:uncharacterized protein YbjT (DUF2867 family)